MIDMIFNWIACGLTILGTIELSRKTPRTSIVNLCYSLGSAILIILFSIWQNWAMVSMYVVLEGLSLRGLKNQWRI